MIATAAESRCRPLVNALNAGLRDVAARRRLSIKEPGEIAAATSAVARFIARATVGSDGPSSVRQAVRDNQNCLCSAFCFPYLHRAQRHEKFINRKLLQQFYVYIFFYTIRSLIR